MPTPKKGVQHWVSSDQGQRHSRTSKAVYSSGNSFQVTEGIELCQKYLSDLTPDDVVLDIGCGTGEVTKYLVERSGAKITGIDSNPDMIQHAKLHNATDNIWYQTVDVQDSGWFTDPGRHEKYSAAVSLNVFHWTPKFKSALQNIYRVLTPGARLLVCQQFQPSQSKIIFLPAMTSQYKWKTLLEQKQFTWEAPYFRALYGESEFNWMENVSTLKNLVASTGFSFNFLENRPSDIELTEENCRPLLPVLQCMSEEQQQQFLNEFLHAVKKETTTSPELVYMLIKPE